MPDIPPVIDLPAWIAENERFLKPPVNNKVAWAPMKDFIVMVVGGPNLRTDYHVDPYEEWFYMHRGSMRIDVMADDGPRSIHIPEGGMWMLPANLPHSPQRPDPDSIGLVIERVRGEGVEESFRWYCQNCATQLHEAWIRLKNIEVDLPPVFEAFHADLTARTCPACGTLHPGKG
ncbi:3-hydroxyanthranilate 3,4-dioxygenase [Amycolatopsis sp. WQ 127309]|uniref:3-hydroxyanthranilate 3,4-dioxygenase n=1 Tax=Amycolatopsis sp. WQ 127309 TaxID=2932773 RepID=UPI001FF1AB0A|nr:3-hydroxyanthranilate 3,4-dioxygenase [Amycolatopsis sp. WQ 127309]UOZ03467.1 3-hydroxyanthranilate 3,4-dioxygenase [Amycolatopsis sp. WQ 127309]